MTHISRILIPVFLVFFVVAMTARDKGLAESPLPELQKALAGLQDQWARNQREYLKQQRTLHDQAEKIREQLCAMGEKAHCAAPQPEPETVAAKISSHSVSHSPVDIKKLAYAVAMAETEDCTTGVGKSRNNCHGIFQCTAQGCAPRTFNSKEESYRAFEDLWLNKYGNRFPTIEDARRYVDSDATDWYATVKYLYFSK